MAEARARRNKLNEAFYAAKDELEKAKKKVDAAEMSIAVAENQLEQTKQAVKSLTKTKNDQDESVRKTCNVQCRGKDKKKCVKRPPCKAAKRRRSNAEKNRMAKVTQKDKQIANLKKLRENKKQLLKTVKKKEAALTKAKTNRSKGIVDFISDLKF